MKDNYPKGNSNYSSAKKWSVCKNLTFEIHQTSCRHHRSYFQTAPIELGPSRLESLIPIVSFSIVKKYPGLLYPCEKFISNRRRFIVNEPMFIDQKPGTGSNFKDMHLCLTIKLPNKDFSEIRRGSVIIRFNLWSIIQSQKCCNWIF